MDMFDNLISLWRSEDLLSQAWEESFEMMLLSNEMFSAAINYLRRGEKIKTLKNLKKRDREINQYQKSVRKKVVTHFSVTQRIEDLPNGLVLLNDEKEINQNFILDFSIGYVPQDIFLVDGTIAENIALGISKKKFDIEISSRLINLLNDSVSYS